MKELSSPLTFFYKFIFPLLWFGGFGFGVRKLIFFPEAYDARWMQYMAVWLGITIFMFFTTGDVKKVYIDGKKLIVSNFYSRAEIDIEQIIAVDGTSFLSPKLVWFTLKEPSSYGKKITFLPKHRMGSGLGKHPLVEDLKKELGL
jgi:hypothetical protein